MPDPISGLVAIAEYGSKFEADVGCAALGRAGIEGVVSHDPAANSVATYFTTDRVFELLVDEADAAAALDLLVHLGDDLPPEFRVPVVPSAAHLRRRRRTKLVALGLIFVMFGGPLLLMLVAQVMYR